MNKIRWVIALVAILGYWAGPFTTATAAEALPAAEPLDFPAPPELLVGRTQFAWCSSLSPDETWLATGYGHWGSNEAGRVVVWDVASGKPRWQAREARGVRTVGISPDGTLVASGNFGGELKLRDAATGKVLHSFRETQGSIERLAFSSDGKRIVTGSNTSDAIRVRDTFTGEVLLTIAGHEEVPYWVAFSDDDQRIVSASRDKTVRIWNTADGKELHKLAHPNEVSAAIFLPGDKQVASVCHDGLLRLWNAESGELVTTFTPPERRGGACAVAVSRDGKLLAANCNDQIHVWDTVSGELTASLPGHPSLVHGLVFNKDATRLFSSAWDRVVCQWDLAAKRELQFYTLAAGGSDPTGPVEDLAYCPEKTLIAVGLGTPVVELRDGASGALVSKLEGHEDAVLALAFAPGGEWLATAGADGEIHLWNLATQDAEVTLPHHEGSVAALAWSPDGKRLISGGSDQTVRVFDTKTWKELAVLEGHTAAVQAVAALPDGRAASVGDDSVVRIWDIAGKSQVAALEGHQGAVRAIAVSPDATTIATAGDDHAVKLWDAAMLKQRASVGGHQQPVQCLAFSPGGKTLASAAAGGGVHFIDPARGTVRKTTQGHQGRVTGLAFLPGAAGLLTAGEDQTIRLWKAGSLPTQPLVSLAAHLPEAFAAEYSSDGKWLATGGKDSLVALRNPATGEIVREFKGANGLVYEVAFSADSRLLAAASSDGQVRVWSVADGKLVTSFKAWKEKFSNARAIAFAPDNRTIVSGAADGTLRMFDVVEKKVKRDLIGQALGVTSIRFSPDGALLVTSTGNWQQWRLPGELRLWDAKTGEELMALPGHAGEIKRVAFSRDGKRLASGGGGGWLFVWDVESRKAIAQLKVGASPSAIAFLNDSNQIAVGDHQGGLAIWDSTSLAMMQRYAGHDKIISGITLSPDGERLATASADGTVKIWEVAD